MTDKKLNIYKKNVLDKNPDQLYLRLINDNDSEDLLLYVVNNKGEKIHNGCVLTVDNDLKVLVVHYGLCEKVNLKKNLFGQAITATCDDAKKAMEMFGKSNKEDFNPFELLKSILMERHNK